jgi:hypothetical protein
MYRVLAILIVLAFTVDTADARRRGHRHYRHHAQVYVVPADAFAMLTPGLSRRDLRRLRARIPGMAPRGVARNAHGQLVPPNWEEQPADPDRRGKRFVSPDGAAWLATSATPVEQEPIADHLKTIAFAEGEEIAYLAGQRDWIAVSGRKGDRIFYRKAVLACDGKVWRHVAFEYPAAARRSVDVFVSRVAAAVTHTVNDGCETAISSR